MYLGFLYFFITIAPSFNFFRGSGFSKALCFVGSEVRNLSRDSCFCFTTFLGFGVKSGRGPANMESHLILLIPYFCRTFSCRKKYFFFIIWNIYLHENNLIFYLDYPNTSSHLFAQHSQKNFIALPTVLLFSPAYLWSLHNHDLADIRVPWV